MCRVYREVKKQTLYTLLLHETLRHTCLRFRKVPRVTFLESYWEQEKGSKGQLSIIMYYGWMHDMDKWFGRYDATYLFHDA